MRESRAIMGDLASAGLSPDQLALVMELAAAVSAEARPIVDKAAERKRTYDRERQREIARNRTNSHETGETSEPADPPPNEYISNPPPETQSPIGDSPLPKSKKRSLTFEVPDWIPAEAWEAFAEMRRRKKKPLDDFTAKQLFGRLRTIRDAGWNIEDVITKAAIGNHDGFWMPDGRDSNLRRANGVANGRDRPMNAEELRAGIRYAEDNQDPDRAAELKRQLAALGGKSADPKIAGMVRSVTEQMRVRA